MTGPDEVPLDERRGADAGDVPGPTGPNLSAFRLWVDPGSNAARQAEAWRTSRPSDAQAMARMARGAQAEWFGDWTSDVAGTVRARTRAITAQGGLPVFVAYNLPLRDCGQHSAGGASSPAAYRQWTRAFAAGLDGRAAIVVLEPDGLAQLDCLSKADREVRLDLLRDAVQVLGQAGALVYLDAGHPRWHAADVMAERLRRAGVGGARGFSLNVSNFIADADNVAYGLALSRRLDGARFVIDSSRNGLGAAPGNAWCNPDGRALGRLPTLETGTTALDAFLWIKRPGESDGTCNGGPRAGTWWAEYALGLVRRSVLAD